MERFDVIVVGAGPAGSVTAYRLARAGVKVLLLDKARFPRDKPCGGGLTIRALRQLPDGLDVGPVVEHVVDRMGFRLCYRTRFERRSSEPLILMTQRRRLDHLLVERAAAAGAEVRDGVRVDEAAAEEHGVVVRAGGRRVAAEALVGADGANGRVRRALDLGGRYVLGVALEGNVPYEAVPCPRRFQGLAEFELGTISGGYGWIFPKDEHVNVGVGGWEREGPRLRAHLWALCRAHGIPQARVEQVRGHRLPLRRPGSRPARGRALLVGDAAGLVDPLSGDGMYEAFVSARLAAEAILGLLSGQIDRLDGYGERLALVLGPGMAASWGAKVAFDRFPRATFALGRLPLAWGAVERMLRGEIRSPGEERGLARAVLKGIELLARAAGDPGRGYRVEAGTA